MVVLGDEQAEFEDDECHEKNELSLGFFFGNIESIRLLDDDGSMARNCSTSLFDCSEIENSSFFGWSLFTLVTITS